MPWNPEQYNQFKAIRNQPFFDLMEMIHPQGLKKAVDIGCGTGEQTRILAEKYEEAIFLGIDSSREMLAKTKEFKNKNLQFKNVTVEEFVQTEKEKSWDLVFSNAALQWSDDHEHLFPGLIHLLSENGQFAIQMPVQNENLLNRLLLELVSEKPFSDYLKGYKKNSPLLTEDEYAQIMFDNGLHNIQVIKKVYPIITPDTDTLYNFIASTALLPYLEQLSEDKLNSFINAYKQKINNAFKKYPAIYSFKRLLLYGNKRKT